METRKLKAIIKKISKVSIKFNYAMMLLKEKDNVYIGGSTYNKWIELTKQSLINNKTYKNIDPTACLLDAIELYVGFSINTEYIGETINEKGEKLCGSGIIIRRERKH